MAVWKVEYFWLFYAWEGIDHFLNTSSVVYEMYLGFTEGGWEVVKAGEYRDSHLNWKVGNELLNEETLKHKVVGNC